MVVPASSLSSWPVPSKVFRRKVPPRCRTEEGATIGPVIAIAIAIVLATVTAVVIADEVAVVIVLAEEVAMSGLVIETAANVPRHRHASPTVVLLLKVVNPVGGQRCRSKTRSRK